MLVLGIETTCDETAASVVRVAPDGRGAILSNVVRSQIEEHAPYGGVVPEIAARAHVEIARPGDRSGAARGGHRPQAELDAIAAAGGPGLVGGVHRRADHGQGDGRWLLGKPLDRGQPPRRLMRLTARLTDDVRLPLPAAAGLRRPHPASCRDAASATTPALGPRRSTTRIGEAFDKVAKTPRPRLSRRSRGRTRGARTGDAARVSPSPAR